MGLVGKTRENSCVGKSSFFEREKELNVKKVSCIAYVNFNSTCRYSLRLMQYHFNMY